jgi:hypothetical protein
MALLFTLTSMVTAALLFLVQPTVARMVLPSFGGSPQVWTTAMLFFQTALLAGYAYSHLATSQLNRRVQLITHLFILAIPLALLPIALSVQPSGRGGLAPSFELLAALTAGVAVPFIVIATTGPLVQRWFSWTSHPAANDPYFMYAAGNIGSIGGLLAYPFLIEPNFSVVDQANLWTYGYWLACGLLGACAVTVWRQMKRPQMRAPTVASAQPLTFSRIWAWLVLAFIPSSLMLGVTAHLSTDVAAMPLLWVFPLVAYLLSFTIAFSVCGLMALRIATWLAPACLLGALVFRAAMVGTIPAISIQVVVVFVGGLLAHGRLAATRPDTSRLTLFYLVVSIGGALGGLFNSLIAPLIFPHVFEYGLILTATLGLVTQWKQPASGGQKLPVWIWFPGGLLMLFAPMLIVMSVEMRNHLNWLPKTNWLANLVLLLALLPCLTPVGKSNVFCIGFGFTSILALLLQVDTSEVMKRTFFGVHRVVREGDVLMLAHGTTVHGRQDMSSLESRRIPLVYYHPRQPLGDLINATQERAHVGVLGLGAGSIAGYGTPDRRITFHEIDPAVIEIAQSHFKYIQDARDLGAQVEIVLGDGRLTLRDKRQVYDLLLADAFSSDSTPVHLLTLEGIEVYLNATKDDGLIGIHISNNYLDLLPVLAGAAEKLNLRMLHRWGDKLGENIEISHWVAIARSAEIFQQLKDKGWELMPDKKIIWTDQRSSIWAIRR